VSAALREEWTRHGIALKMNGSQWARKPALTQDAPHQLKPDAAVRCLSEMEVTTETPRGTVVIALALSVMSLCAWLVFIGFRDRPIERRVSNVALSSTGRWLAGGTPQGKVTIWDRASGTAPRQIDLRHGPLNDLQFSPDETLLAIASRDLGIYDLGQSAALRTLRSDERNYGTVRFSRDGETALVITGKAVIEALDTHSGATRLKVCCSSIYGEVAFIPDGRAIVNAGHWPSVWDARSGQLVGRLTTNRQNYTFRPIGFDGARGTILMGSQDGRVYVWDLTTRQLVAISAAQSDYVDTLAVSAAGWVVYAGFGKMLRLWNPQTGQQRSLPAALPTSNLIVGPDGTSIIFGTADGRIEYWDARTAQRLSGMTIPRP
jgi:WD40 repeat protein